MKRAADGSPVRSASPRHEGGEQPQQERGPTERVADVPGHLMPVMRDIDMSEQLQAVQDFSVGFMPQSAEDASNVAEWCATEGLADHFVHVVKETGVSKVWISSNLSLVTDNLPKCPGLEELVLEGDQISDEQVVGLLNALKGNSTLRELFLSDCPTVTEDTLKLLATTLSVNPGLRNIGVSVSRHPTAWIYDLAAALKDRPYPLLELTLDDVSLTSEHLTALSSAFGSNARLKGLELLALTWGDLQDAGPLVDIVKGLPSLKTLDLSGHGASSVSGIVKWLGEGYRGELRTLTMSGMKFATPEEKTSWMTCTSAMLCTNTTLRTLDLRDNSLGGGLFRPDVGLLCTAIEVNSALSTLHIDRSNFSVAAVDQLITSLRRNVALTTMTLAWNLTKGVPTEAQLGQIQLITAHNQVKLLLCTTELIEGAGAGLLNLPPEIGVRIGHFAAGTTAGDLHQARHLPFVNTATYASAVDRRSRGYAWMLGDQMCERGGFEKITEILRPLKALGMTIRPEHMDELMQRAAQDGRLEDLIKSIERSGFESRPSAAVQASLVADAESMQRPELVNALQRFGHAALAPTSVGPEVEANQQVNDS